MRALHLFCGIGVGAAGFVDEGFEVCGAVDNDAGACRDFELVTGSPATCADLELMTPAELAAACDGVPDVVFTSPPCKGFSRCLSAAASLREHYQRMNALTLRGVWLALEAFPRLPKLLLMENVPAILTRGAEWLERIEAMLRGYGYAVTRSTHDCGELGGLAQHRRRFLLVARHIETCPPFLRVPATQRVRGIGEVLSELPVPVPGSTEGGPMHRLPKLAAINWVRLALIPAGKDWRALKTIESVELRQRGTRHNGQWGVEDWDDPAHAVLAHNNPRETFSSVADPRLQCTRRDGGHGVKGWDEASAALIGHPCIDNFPAQVADPRLAPAKARHAGTCGVQGWTQASHVITGGHGRRDWDSVADPREPIVEGPPVDLANKRAIHMVIRAADGTWHRPMTTLELAALQSMRVRNPDGTWLQLSGNDAQQREHIGNAVPRKAAAAIARSCAETLALASGGWRLVGDGSIWVRREGLHA